MNAVPQDADTEVRVLSCCLADPVRFSEARLRRDDFYDPRHREVWSAMEQTAARGPLSPALVCDTLDRDGLLDAVGGKEFVAWLRFQFATTVGFDRFCAKLRGFGLRRRIIDAAVAVAEYGYENGEPDECATFAERTILEALRAGGTTAGLEDVVEVASRVVAECADRIESGMPPCASTGLSDVDTALRGGLYPSDLVLVGARPSMGKSAFGVQIARSVARECERHDSGCVAVFSVESSEASLVKRILKGDTGRDEHLGLLEPQALEAWRRCVEEMPRGRMFVDFRAGVSVLDIASECRRLHARRRVRCVVIDYLQFLVPHQARLPREQQINFMARECKEMAKDLGAPVVLLAQLNRGVEQRPDKRPMMSDLRESGAIEQHADTVLLLYRDDYYHADSDDAGICEVIVGKQREGTTGTVKVAWDAKRVRFHNLARREPQHRRDHTSTWQERFDP